MDRVLSLSDSARYFTLKIIKDDPSLNDLHYPIIFASVLQTLVLLEK